MTTRVDISDSQAAAAPAPTDTWRAALGDIVALAAQRAGDVDRAGSDVRPALRRLGAAGLLDRGTPGGAGTLGEQVEVTRALAQSCVATAFSAWAQRMAIGYLASWGGAQLRGALLPSLVSGERAGATAMATAFQDALGLKQVGVHARPDGDEVVLDGTIPWASNLFPDGAAVVLPARTADGRRLIVAITTDLDGVGLAPYPSLLALGATASTSMTLDGVRIPSAWVLTDRFLDFLTDVRPAFLLLQVAFCLGLVDAALTGADGRFVGVTGALADDHHRLVERRDDLDGTLRRLLADGAAPTVELVRLRLAAGQLGVDATRHESTVRGGAGYLAGSPTARRLREAAFLPIQSPTEAQLRWELSQSA